MTGNSLVSKLESYRLLIHNSRDAQVSPLLKSIGIDTNYIKEGENLYQETINMVNLQKKEYQEQSRMYDKFYTEKDEVEAKYNQTLKLVRVLSQKDGNLQNRLGITGRTQAIEQWIERALDFYNRLEGEVEFMKKAVKFKITTERIQSERDGIEGLRVLRNEVTIEKGQAQEATRLRNEKLDQLEDYSRELKALAQLALESQPQLLEKLGIVVKS